MRGVEVVGHRCENEWANGVYFQTMYDVQVARCELSRWATGGGTSARVLLQTVFEAARALASVALPDERGDALSGNPRAKLPL